MTWHIFNHHKNTEMLHTRAHIQVLSRGVGEHLGLSMDLPLSMDEMNDNLSAVSRPIHAPFVSPNHIAIWPGECQSKECGV